MPGKFDLGAIPDGGHELFNRRREMAEANGVAADGLVLVGCR